MNRFRNKYNKSRDVHVEENSSYNSLEIDDDMNET